MNEFTTMEINQQILQLNSVQLQFFLIRTLNIKILKLTFKTKVQICLSIQLTFNVFINTYDIHRIQHN